MDYQILRCVYIENDSVYTDSASSAEKPTVYKKQEQPYLTYILRLDGMHGVLKELGRGVFEGTIRLQPWNCPVAEALKRAGDTLKPPLRFSLDSNIAADFIATLAENLIIDPFFSPVPALKKLEDLREDLPSVLAISKNNPAAFNFSVEKIRRNRGAALLYIRECAGDRRFVYPSYFKEDKDLAMEALKQNGDVFHQLSPSLRGDRDVVRYAYNCRIPREGFAYRASDIDQALLNDPAFMREIVSICSDLIVRDVPYVLKSKSVAEAWVNHNNYIFDNLDLLTDRILADPRLRKSIYEKAGNNRDLRAKVNHAASMLGITTREESSGFLFNAPAPK